MAARLVFLTRPGCSLCETARGVVQSVAEETATSWEERDVTADPDDARAYLDLVPVVLVDGAEVAYWRVDEARLRSRLAGPDAPTP